MASRTIRVDDEIFALVRQNQRHGETDSETVSRLLKEASEEKTYMMMVDYEKVPTEHLIKRLAIAEARAAADPEDGGCGNGSDNLCCDVCGIPQLVAELRKRGSTIPGDTKAAWDAGYNEGLDEAARGQEVHGSD